MATTSRRQDSESCSSACRKMKHKHPTKKRALVEKCRINTQQQEPFSTDPPLYAQLRDVPCLASCLPSAHHAMRQKIASAQPAPDDKDYQRQE